jgi:hypothetical protein
VSIAPTQDCVLPLTHPPYAVTRSSRCFRSRKYNCVREMPNCRAALDLFPLTSRIARSIAWRSTTFTSVLSTIIGTMGGARHKS